MKFYLLLALIVNSTISFSSEIEVNNVKNSIIVETNKGNIIVNTIISGPRDYEIIQPSNDKEIISALASTKKIAKDNGFFTEDQEGDLKYSDGNIFVIGGAVESNHYNNVKIKKDDHTLLLGNKKIGIVVSVDEENVSVLWKKQNYCIEKENSPFACSDKGITLNPFVFEIAAASLRRVYDY